MSLLERKMRQLTFVIVIAVLSVALVAAFSVFMPVKKVTYVGHSYSEILSAVRGGNVTMAKVTVPNGDNKPNSLVFDLRDGFDPINGDRWSLLERDRIEDVLAAIGDWNDSAPKEQQISLERITSYNWNFPPPQIGPTPTAGPRQGK